MSCDQLIEPGRKHLGLCIRCRGRLTPISGDRCPGCCRPLFGFRIPEGFCCSSCRKRPPSHDRLLALWVFRSPIDSVIHGLKFERLEFLGQALATEMACHLRRAGIEADLVTWVPLHWRRKLVRGYNQAECIARPLARALDLPARRLLRKTRATPAQASLGLRARTSNLGDSMTAHRSAKVDGLRLLVIDDVATTGSTLRAAAGALREAGAAEITALVAARTAGPEEPTARNGPIC